MLNEIRRCLQKLNDNISSFKLSVDDMAMRHNAIWLQLTIGRPGNVIAKQLSRPGLSWSKNMLLSDVMQRQLTASEDDVGFGTVDLLVCPELAEFDWQGDNLSARMLIIADRSLSGTGNRDLPAVEDHYMKSFSRRWRDLSPRRVQKVRALAFGGNRYAYIVQGLFSDAELLQFATHKVPPTGLTEAIVHEVMLGIHWPQLEKCRNFIVGQRLSIEHNSVYGLIEIIV